ncbi:MAG: hypothetical protein L6R41_007028 [Letrouitia leprolyta]|nr:MAG: hypothetical protein L6R41_007028 [Letrouitia leprolyta]
MAISPLHNNPAPRIPWTDDEAESAIILRLIVIDKHERVAHLNTRFGRKRTLTSVKAHVKKSKRSGRPHSHLYQLWRSNMEKSPDSALVALSRLLGRNLIEEDGILWYREELISLASLCSGPSSYATIQRALEIEYGIWRDIRAQVERMQEVWSPSNAIWVRYHNDGSGRLRAVSLNAWTERRASEQCLRGPR